jgi:hypothetical protein
VKWPPTSTAVRQSLDFTKLLTSPSSRARLVLQARTFRNDSAVIEKRAQEIVGKLRYYHQLGQTSQSDKRTTVELAVENGIGISTAFKARAFARLYEKKELNNLCKLRRPDGLPLNWAYVPYLLTVKDREKRA